MAEWRLEQRRAREAEKGLLQLRWGVREPLQRKGRACWIRIEEIQKLRGRQQSEEAREIIFSVVQLQGGAQCAWSRAENGVGSRRKRQEGSHGERNRKEGPAAWPRCQEGPSRQGRLGLWCRPFTAQGYRAGGGGAGERADIQPGFGWGSWDRSAQGKDHLFLLSEDVPYGF